MGLRTESIPLTYPFTELSSGTNLKCPSSQKVRQAEPVVKWKKGSSLTQSGLILSCSHWVCFCFIYLSAYFHYTYISFPFCPQVKRLSEHNALARLCKRFCHWCMQCVARNESVKSVINTTTVGWFTAIPYSTGFGVTIKTKAFIWLLSPSCWKSLQCWSRITAGRVCLHYGVPHYVAVYSTSSGINLACEQPELSQSVWDICLVWLGQWKPVTLEKKLTPKDGQSDGRVPGKMSEAAYSLACCAAALAASGIWVMLCTTSEQQAIADRHTLQHTVNWRTQQVTKVLPLTFPFCFQLAWEDFSILFVVAMLPPFVLIILRTNLFHAVILSCFTRICNGETFKTGDKKNSLQKRCWLFLNPSVLASWCIAGILFSIFAQFSSNIWDERKEFQNNAERAAAVWTG